MKRHNWLLALSLTCVLAGTAVGQAPIPKDFSGIWVTDMDRTTFQTTNPPVSTRLVIDTRPGLLRQPQVKIQRADIFRDGRNTTWAVEIVNNRVTSQQGFPATTSVKMVVKNGQLVIEQNARFQNGATGDVVLTHSLIDGGATLLVVEQVTLGGRRTTDRLYFLRRPPGPSSSPPDNPP